MFGIKQIGMMAGALLLVGCSAYSLQELRHTTPQGSEFQKALAKQYMAFATQEEEDYDWADSWHFADKGLTAAYGNDVEPEHPDDWRIDDEMLPLMRKARELVVNVVTSQVKERYPQLAARTIFYFDCWVEQQEEGWQTSDINFCRNQLHDALQRLEAPDIGILPMVDPEGSAVFSPESMPEEDYSYEEDGDVSDILASLHDEDKKTTVEERVANTGPPQGGEFLLASPFSAPEGIETSPYMVFFDTASTRLPDAGKRVLDSIINTLAGTDSYSIVIGANEHVEFVDKRAQAVKEKLVSGGISEDSITISVAQVPDFMADTGQGDSDLIQHRVEIYLNQ